MRKKQRFFLAPAGARIHTHAKRVVNNISKTLNKMADVNTFIQRVAKMRELQKEYFRTKSMIALQKAKQMEVVVDRDLKSFSDLAPQSPTEQEIAF